MQNWRFIGVGAVGVTTLAPPVRGQTVRVRDGQDDGRDRRVRTIEILTGRGSEIGVSVRDVDAADVSREKLASASGAVVDEVRSDSPAEKAGLKAGDVVTEFDGERVRSARQFARLVEETPAGRSVPATVMRGGKSVQLSVAPDRSSGLAVSGRRDRDEGGPMVREFHGMQVPGFRFEMPDMRDLEDLPGLAVRPDRARLGVGVQSLTRQLADYFGAPGGVLVNEVTPDSPAAKAGVKAGDVITSVNGTSVEDAGDLRRELWREDEKDARDVSLGIVRDRKPTSLTVTIERGETQERTPARRRV
jgi:serine protease Do